jgi:Rod binding domain-containing protein
MDLNSTLSCPIKLPPLGSYPVSTNTSSVENARESELSAANNLKGSTPFSKILKNIGASKQLISNQTSNEEITEAGQQLESFLLALVFKQAFNNRLSSGFFGNSYASRMYFDMFIEAAAEEAAKITSLGIAELIALDINREKLSEKEEGNETQELHGVRQGNAKWVKKDL